MGGYERARIDYAKHLRFEELPPSTTGEALGRVKRFHVISKITGAKLGFVKWYGAWHKYCFFPMKDTVFDNSCMKTIMEFIDEQMRLRREARRKKDGA